MKYVLLFLLSVCNVLAFAGEYVVLNTNMYVRTKPTVKSNAVEGQWGNLLLSKGEVHRVIGESGEWYHIVISGFNNTQGYIMKKYCLSDGDQLPSSLPNPEGEETVIVSRDNDGVYWLKKDVYYNSKPLLKGVWQGNILVFPYTMKQYWGNDYQLEDYLELAASYVILNGQMYAIEYTRTD